MNKIHQIIKNLEDKGESKDYIIGYMSAMIKALEEMTPEESSQYLNSTIKQTEQ
jgi:hypothetical protein